MRRAGRLRLRRRGRWINTRISSAIRSLRSMKIFVTRTVEVEADSYQQAIAKFNDGEIFITTATLHAPTETPRGGKIPVTQPTKPIQPLPRKDWPLWAKALAAFSKPEDKGLGDIVARMIGAENSAAFKTWYKTTFGKSCGCTGRQAYLNRTYPLHE